MIAIFMLKIGDKDEKHFPFAFIAHLLRNKATKLKLIIIFKNKSIEYFFIKYSP